MEESKSPLNSIPNRKYLSMKDKVKRDQAKGPAMYGSKSPMQMKGSWMSKHCSK